MKKIKLSTGDYTLIDDSDYELVNQWKWQKSNQGYASRSKRTGKVNGEWKYMTQYMHRLLMGNPKGIGVDHVNGNKLDNSRSNLRLATQSQNLMNKSKSRNGISRYKGVTKDDRNAHRKWHAHIQVNGVKRSLKYHLTEVEASRAYDRAALEYFGAFARLNNA